MALMRRTRTVFSGVAGTPWYSLMYFTWVSGTEQDHLDEVAAFWGAIDARIDNNVSWATEDDMAIVESSTGEIVSVEVGSGGTGTGGGTSDPLPAATQGLVNWLTGAFVGGRQVRGKCYIPGLCEDDNTATGVMVGTTQTIIQNAADALIANTSAPGPLSVFSRVNLVRETVTSATVPTKWAVLRSRRD